MTLPKLAILLLRGLEGCGVTMYARHLKAYYDSKDVKCDIFVLKIKRRIGRPETSSDLDIIEFKFDECEQIVNQLNSDYDLVQVHSVPAKSAGADIADSYVENLLCPITTRKVFINHDHSTASFTRNADYLNAIRACDVTLAHSLVPAKRGFVNWLDRQGATDVRVDKLDVFFHAPVANCTRLRAQREKKIICAGRSASWKRTELAFRLHALTRELGYITEVIGYERSIGVYQVLNQYEELYDNRFFKIDDLGNGKGHTCASAFSNANPNEWVFDYLDEHGQSPDVIYSIGPYKYKRGLERICRSAFAIHGRTFEHNGLDYGDNMEYQTIECCLNSMPIVHRHFADTACLPGTETPLKEAGVVLTIDDDNVKEGELGPNIINGDQLVAEMEELWNGDYDKRRAESIKLIQDYYSTEKLVPVMMERCL